jgi:hypothetical protein
LSVRIMRIALRGRDKRAIERAHHEDRASWQRQNSGKKLSEGRASKGTVWSMLGRSTQQGNS